MIKQVVEVDHYASSYNSVAYLQKFLLRCVYRNLPYFCLFKFRFLNFQLAKFSAKLERMKIFYDELFKSIKHFNHVAGGIDQLVKLGDFLCSLRKAYPPKHCQFDT